MSRHQPLHGADSAEAYELHPYLVILRDDDGDRIKVRIPAALGPNDARGQARDLYEGYDPIHTERDASLDYEESEELRGRVAS